MTKPSDSTRTTAVVDAQQIHRFFRTAGEETLALRGVDLTVERGEMVAVVGASGSGKSTLIQLLAGLDRPDGGSVAVAGTNLAELSESDLARFRSRHVGMLFQSDNLLEHLTVLDNLRVAQGIAGQRDHDRIRFLLDDLDIDRVAMQSAAGISGGERARAALAIALVSDPVVVLADEPTGELDSKNEAAVLRLLAAATTRGAAVVVATHSAAVAHQADRRLELGGRAVL